MISNQKLIDAALMTFVGDILLILGSLAYQNRASVTILVGVSEMEKAGDNNRSSGAQSG
tara:strand:- start:507 stop:683 length:177 start_codon:yes stop_codon:yes gene_type:complete